MVDIFMLLQISGAGDELQGIKRGIMEMADLVAITKADGDNRHRAELARAQIFNALKLFPPTESEWTPQVLTCSSLSGKGIGDVWNTVVDFINHTKANGFFQNNRNRQGKYWMYESINETLKSDFYTNERIAPLLAQYEADILGDRISSFVAAKNLLDLYRS
jgi:LAO/AO transport system kinase